MYRIGLQLAFALQIGLYIGTTFGGYKISMETNQFQQMGLVRSYIRDESVLAAAT